MSLKYVLPLLCAGLLLTAPTFAAPEPPVPSHATAGAADTSAVVVVSKMLTQRAKNNFAGMYDLLTANMKKGVSRTQFLEGAPQSSANIATMTPELRGQYALFADAHNALKYTFAVVGPDPTNPDVVLVHAFPKPAPGVVPATLKIYTVADPGAGKGTTRTHHRTVDALQSIAHAMMEAKGKPTPPPTAPATP